MKQLHSLIPANIKITPIRYKFKATYSWGFDLTCLLDGYDYIQYSFEPHRSGKDRWLVKDHVRGCLHYIPRLTKGYLKFLNLSEHKTGFIL